MEASSTSMVCASPIRVPCRSSEEDTCIRQPGFASTGASLLVTANPGCLMQVSSSLERQGTRIGLAHTIEVLDASIRGLPVSTLGPQH